MLGKKTTVFVFLVVSFICLAGTSPAQQVLTAEQELGKRLFFDKNLSSKKNQSCATCHDPATGFVDPDNINPPFFPVSKGSVVTLSGVRNAPSAAYAAFSPFFCWDAEKQSYVGGQFWDGRASTLAEQAGGPFLNPVEQAMPNKWSVVSKLRENRVYVSAFKDIYNLDLRRIPKYSRFYRTPATPPGVSEVYDRMTRAIGEFEKSQTFNQFSSKFDYYLAGRAELTAQELRGLELFNTKAKCALCHPSNSTTAPDGSMVPPLFTNFTYHNLGLPANMDVPGAPLLPDLGLGGRLDIAAQDPLGTQRGKFKVMTLRNIALTPPYGHNGVFKSLGQILFFYNTRDVLGRVQDNTDPGFGVTGWPLPEVLENMNIDKMGNLGLVPEEGQAIIAFLNTLTDGYGPPLPVTSPPHP